MSYTPRHGGDGERVPTDPYYTPRHERTEVLDGFAIVPTPVHTESKPKPGLAIASLVLGIFGVPFGWLLLGIPCALALMFGYSARRAAARGTEPDAPNMSTAGISLGYFGLVLTALFVGAGLLGTALGLT